MHALIVLTESMEKTLMSWVLSPHKAGRRMREDWGGGVSERECFGVHSADGGKYPQKQELQKNVPNNRRRNEKGTGRKNREKKQ